MEYQKSAKFVYFLIFFATLLTFVLVSNYREDRRMLRDELMDSLKTWRAEMEADIELINRTPIPNEVIVCGERVPLQDWWVRRNLAEAIRFYTGNKPNRQKLNSAFDLTSIYFPLFQKKLAQDSLLDDFNFLPLDDLMLLSISEAFLDNEAISKRGARGAWQIMKATGKGLGLKISKNIDERKDFEKAGVAALNLLKANRERFGNWALALAAYNTGPDNVKKAIAEQGDSSYYKLIFVPETVDYNYYFIAVAVIWRDPELYGFRRVAYEGAKIWAVEYRVKKKEDGSNCSLIEIAKEFGLPPLEFKLLNPQFVGKEIPPGTYQIKTSKNPDVFKKEKLVLKTPS